MTDGHYATAGLAERVLAALGDGPLTLRDLAPLDQFHVGGLKSTQALAELAEVTAGDMILDIGSGIGGPARFLAATFGCCVTGLDLSAEYTQLAARLAERVGLAGQVSAIRGDALAMPFPDASFDLLWTQHAAMNIPDRPRLHAEMARLLKPGGRLALHDVCAGTGELAYFPLPWAAEAGASALLSPDETYRQLLAAGFAPLHWRDATADALDALSRAPAVLPPLSLQLLLGERFPEMLINYRRSLEEGRARVVEAVLCLPSA
ncbi:MAG TPA: methyltransferase domain-containing protein [Patescibacteria group bacterium]|nr:methyltransferase domain-containing protein [Patescibacteria group bacterium]